MRLSELKAAVFHPAAREAIRTFPEAVRRELGKAIYDLQQRKILGMPLSRPMVSVGAGAAELRIRDSGGIYRVFYYVSSPRGILVFHAFMKKSQATSKHELQLGKRRLKEMLHEEV
jgi:phage-related protein